MFLTLSNAALLIGVSGAAVPLLLHLLSRARYRSLDWGAMLFLEGLEARQQYSGRINQILLLVLRMAVVAVLAIALAEPVLQQWGPEPDSAGAALQAANHGQLLCMLGAAACGAMTVWMLLLIARPTGAPSTRLRRGMGLVVAVVAGIGAISLARRSAAWDGEVRRLLAQQSATVRPTDASLHRRIDVAILLDCSAGMNFDENGHTRFELARGAAKQILAGLHRGDRVSLLLLGQHQPESELDPTPDLQSVADRIDAARTGHEPADIGTGLLKAQEFLDRDAAAARDIYIVCDRQASNWRGVNDYYITHRWPESVKNSAAAVRLFIVPIGGADAENLAVESITLNNPPAIVGQPADVTVNVHNYGLTARAAVPLTVSINGRPVFDTTVSVAAGRAAQVEVPLPGRTLVSAGSQSLTAEIRTAGYRDDDKLDAVIDAIEPIRVLIISGDEYEGTPLGQFRSESDFLRLALSPERTLRRGGSDPCKVEVVPADLWPSGGLDRYQVVILANVERFTAAQAREIEQYVYGGGGLLIAPGNLARVENYNQQLWREGTGILPAELEDATSADGAEATTIVGYDPTTPIFEFLHDQPDLTLTSTIGRFFPVGNRSSDSRGLAWYTSGSPFLIESRAGRGKTLLMTTSLDADWSTLPLSSFYLPYVQSAVRYLAAATLPSRNLGLGQPILATFEDPADDHATVELPDGDSRQVLLARFGSVADLRYTDTQEPGIYHVRVRERTGEQTIQFAVHLPPEESDLTQLSDARWDELEHGLHLRRIDQGDRALASVVAGSRQGYGLWGWAMAVVLVFGVAELALAGHWSRDAHED